MGRDLAVLDGAHAVCRLPAGGEVPAWANEGEGLRAVVRTPEELSIVCDERAVPAGVEASGGWRAMRVVGRLDLSLTGVLIELLAPLEGAQIPIFAISTFDTDYVLVPAGRLDDASTALESAGHRFTYPVG